MRRQFCTGVAAAALITSLTFAGEGIASANTYSESKSGTDLITTTTTLKYQKAHSKFKLRVWVTKNGGLFNWSVSDKYSIKMYDKNNHLRWSAANQRDRTYDIGSNISRIVLKRNQAAASQATTHWQRR